jgi:hypothetical protein
MSQARRSGSFGPAAYRALRPRFGYHAEAMPRIAIAELAEAGPAPIADGVLPPRGPSGRIRSLLAVDGYRLKLKVRALVGPDQSNALARPGGALEPAIERAERLF